MEEELAKDFKEFLSSLNSSSVEYLLIGGYAVGVHGHVRATNDLDIWIRISTENAARVAGALERFGMPPAQAADHLAQPNSLLRMGVPPLRIEIVTTISGVEFDACYAERQLVELDGISVPVISLRRLRENKAASGRLKDLADLESLPK